MELHLIFRLKLICLAHELEKCYEHLWEIKEMVVKLQIMALFDPVLVLSHMCWIVSCALSMSTQNSLFSIPLKYISINIFIHLIIMHRLHIRLFSFTLYNNSCDASPIWDNEQSSKNKSNFNKYKVIILVKYHYGILQNIFTFKISCSSTSLIGTSGWQI